MDGIGGADRGGGAGRTSDRGRADATKSAEKAANKKAETEKKAAQTKSSLTDYFKDMFTPTGGWVQAGQRQHALEVTRQSPPGSVGAAIRGPLEAVKAVGSLCAGNIGDFYEANRELLSRPATPENIAEFARLETENFKAQQDCSRVVGGLIDADTRAAAIGFSAQLNRVGDWTRERLKDASDGLSRTVNGPRGE